MSRAIWICGALCIVNAFGWAGCRRGPDRKPPPDARRPVIKTEDELAAERAVRIEAGRVVPTSSPVIHAVDRVMRPKRRVPSPITPGAGAIEADILIVNDAVLTVAEVLYPLWDELKEIRQTQTIAGFRQRAGQLLRRAMQREVGGLLIYAEALAQLEDEQRHLLAEAVDKRLDEVTTRGFGGSKARMTADLAAHELTVEQYRESLQRDMVVQQYTREKLLPRVQIRRDELWDYYTAHRADYSKPETRELLMIELPFEKLLPQGQSWERASSAARSQAKLRAMQRAREAHAALEEQPFEDVAREYSVGSHAERGGSWGMIGRPLRAPYDHISGRIFEYRAGQYSEPIELPSGWYIVECGRVEPASQRSFLDVQNEIRRELMERRFARLSVDYVLRLAENATISSLDRFIEAALRKAETETAPLPTSGE